MENIKDYEKFKINNYCTEFMIPVPMMCISLSSAILSLTIFNFPLVFKISLLLVDIYEYIS